MDGKIIQEADLSNMQGLNVLYYGTNDLSSGITVKSPKIILQSFRDTGAWFFGMLVIPPSITQFSIESMEVFYSQGLSSQKTVNYSFTPSGENMTIKRDYITVNYRYTNILILG